MSSFEDELKSELIAYREAHERRIAEEERAEEERARALHVRLLAVTHKMLGLGQVEEDLPTARYQPLGSHHGELTLDGRWVFRVSHEIGKWTGDLIHTCRASGCLTKNMITSNTPYSSPLSRSDEFVSTELVRVRLAIAIEQLEQTPWYCAEHAQNV